MGNKIKLEKKKRRGFWEWLAEGTIAEPWSTAEEIMRDPEFKRQQEDIRKLQKIVESKKSDNDSKS